MRAVWYDRQGPAAEVLTLGSLPDPAPGHGEALVRLEASGVNPSDVRTRAGLQGPMDYPRIVPNSDGAGIVLAVGPGVSPAWVGKRVWLHNGQRNGRAIGTAAELIALDADLLSELPDRVSFAEGATLGIPCMTAHRGVFVAGPVQGRTLLVTGGAGAVGNYAVQLATWAGARVIATVSSDEKADKARAAGAAATINYHRQDVAAEVTRLTDGLGVDHVVEVEFGGNLATTLPSVRANGSIAVYGTAAERMPRVAMGDLMRRNLTLHTIYLPGVPHEARRRAQRDITEWVGSGTRLLSVAGTWPLAETAAAHAALEQGGKRGTIVVMPQQ
ncbi:MAG TPA: NADPH:quinone reductase [Stellaceae bacterium]|nr:NADPH:quinone reductase [Stellaceae bacterium]